uniref:COP9 signalosome complex subunit 9 isoform X1 n=1 Tax=Myxine glutinosa TaxID=7769 RepID=UPI00358F648C
MKPAVVVDEMFPEGAGPYVDLDEAGGSSGLLMDLAANEKAVHGDFYNDSCRVLAVHHQPLLVKLPKSGITAQLHSFILPSVESTSTFSSTSFFPPDFDDLFDDEDIQ